MKISGNHTVEEINGARCSVIEKLATAERTDFLKALLEHNGYTVQFQKNIPAPPKPSKPGQEISVISTPAADNFKIGVTDISFITSVMVFSRKLITLNNKTLLPAYWNQEEKENAEWYWKA